MSGTSGHSESNNPNIWVIMRAGIYRIDSFHCISKINSTSNIVSDHNVMDKKFPFNDSYWNDLRNSNFQKHIEYANSIYNNK